MRQPKHTPETEAAPSSGVASVPAETTEAMPATPTAPDRYADERATAARMKLTEFHVHVDGSVVFNAPKLIVKGLAKAADFTAIPV